MAAGFKTATVRAVDVPATQTDFPTYIDLDRLGITTLAEAESVRVYADSGKSTEWAREIVSVTEMHVKVPSLTSSTEIFVDWDGVRADYAVGATYGRNAVWTGYSAVWHLGEASGNAFDSTGAGNDLTDNNTVGSATGQIGDGRDFVTGSSEHLEASSSIVDGAGDVSFSLWVKFDINQNQMLVGNGDNSSGWYLYYAAGGNQEYRFRVGSTINLIEYGITPSLSEFHHVVGTYDTSENRAKLYIAGALVSSQSVSAFQGSATNNLVLGSWKNGAGLFFDGKEDECRVSTIIFSDDWVETEYNNQNDEATFWGTWTTAGGGVGAAFIPTTTIL